MRAGTVHAIVGENGAGKSTLMKILYGMQKPDEGSIEVDGRPVSFSSPADAIPPGIGMVHQHFMLADNLTVLENVVLGAEPAASAGSTSGPPGARIVEISDSYGLGLEPDRLVEDLGVGDRQRVEILKVLYRGARILILDEPTAVLVPQEVDELFGNLRELKAEGITILFISHKLDEVLAVADEITVMRRGTTVATVRPTEVTARRAGRADGRRRAAVAGDPRVDRTTGRRARGPRADPARPTTGGPVLDDISLTIHAGEVLGVAGVEGNGQAELVDAIMGMRPATGTVRLGDRELTGLNTRHRREAGIGYIPEDRQRQGLLLEAPLWENRILGHQTPAAQRHAGRGSTGPAPGPTPSGSSASTTCGRRASTSRPRALSGGNQQKLIVGREMSGEPVLLLAAHPTRGVDVGAQAADLGRAADRAGGRAGRAADLGRPGRADRAVRHDRRDPARADGRYRRPAHGHAGGARLGDDRRRRDRRGRT